MTETLAQVAALLLLPPLLLGVDQQDQGARSPAGAARRCCSPTTTSPSCCARAWSSAGPRPGSSSPAPVVALVTTLLAGLLVPLGSFAAPVSFAGDVDPLRLPARARPLLHRGGRARHRLGLRGHGRGARGRPSPAWPSRRCSSRFWCWSRLSGSLQPRPDAAAAPKGACRLAAPAPLVLVAVGLFIVLLAENCRIPVDDPNTHLELTMIHEVMVLDHSGPLLGAGALRRRRSSSSCSARCSSTSGAAGRSPAGRGCDLASLGGRRWRVAVGSRRGRVGHGPAAAAARARPADRGRALLRLRLPPAAEVTAMTSLLDALLVAGAPAGQPLRLGSSRIGAVIRIVAAQGVLLGAAAAAGARRRCDRRARARGGQRAASRAW